MCGVSYDVTGYVPVTLPSSVFYMCIRDTFQTADWGSLVENSFLHQIYGCD